jgi:hypothetical protein
MAKTEPTLEVAAIDVKISQEPSDAVVVDRSPQVLSSHPMVELDFSSVELSQEPFQQPTAVKGDPQAPPTDAMSEVGRKNLKLFCQEPSTSLEIERNRQEPRADPMFEVRTFLKLLGRR